MADKMREDSPIHKGNTAQGDGVPVEFARLDLDREHRKGVPEVILAQGKRQEDVLAIARQFVDRTGRAIVSRVDDQLLVKLRSEFADCTLSEHSPSRMVVIKRHDYQLRPTGGRVGVVSAGTSDVPVAEEARIIASEMGCEAYAVYDVGVAGIHRLFDPLRALMEESKVDVLVVAAGMDGALPSVVAGLVDVPVIGLPTSVGYGIGGQGVAALMSMLQTCSPGLTVVNIDNGVGAGATAALIANRMARIRAAV
ncbi:MAG TPA: nickel pincer cofactor biosynthesis protein LarB [Chloroflexota bacterium]|nr:nickel pincer cofactor biosynthesis protein LarB [Chloroflexota bacterium]